MIAPNQALSYLAPLAAVASLFQVTCSYLARTLRGLQVVKLRPRKSSVVGYSQKSHVVYELGNIFFH
jgi:hypothetical protein